MYKTQIIENYDVCKNINYVKKKKKPTHSNLPILAEKKLSMHLEFKTYFNLYY